MTTKKPTHLRIYDDKSEYHSDGAAVQIFDEGKSSLAAIKRMSEIKAALENGFLVNLITKTATGESLPDMEKIDDNSTLAICDLVESLTSEAGRALIGISVMQLCIKAISPEQDIRLHKSGRAKNSFSWTEGVSMRSLDKPYVTPVLRQFNLLKLNADGFMMTRSLAENYPYTHLYKAQLRGARQSWLTLVNQIESDQTDPKESLTFLLLKLCNAAENFEKAASALLLIHRLKLQQLNARDRVKKIIKEHIESSDYAARLLEICMHSLAQALIETGTLDTYELTPLTQMRSANKKHKNIGDIEFLENNLITESWDAKYGKGYLREEIEEVAEKIADHEALETAGFVTTVSVERTEEISKRIEEIEALHDIELVIISIDDWVDLMYERALNTNVTTEDELSRKWVAVYTEYLCQKRRHQAPIDEPCLSWVTALTSIFSNVVDDI
tara:strand:- start:314 stop:1642 length:1329 start_codon:yes stop_codon:yes gene_type:complete